MKIPTIEFVSHASVIISHDEISILSDPWFSGAAFHNGWRLIYEPSKSEIVKALNKITHIFISHEHPDHFSPIFFKDKNIRDILINRGIEFLFQCTKDKRVITFLKNQGFKVKEFNSTNKVKLSHDVEIQIVKSGFYDSLLIFKTPNFKIINMNDCPIKEDSQIKKIRKLHGAFDLLLTQFSYAAWKGGIKNKTFRAKAAEEKLETIEKQARLLDCKSVIPFASFIYFSNELNFYMNDSINTPTEVIKYFSNKKSNVFFFQPGEIQNINNLKQNKLSIDFWNHNYNEIKNKKLKIDKYVDTINFNDLNLTFKSYKEKIFRKNSKILIFLLSKIKFMNFFQPLKIKLIDHDKIYNYSIFNGLNENIDIKEYDIKMHSQSLFFILKNEFGFDTLTVNGCFEANEIGFIKVTKTLALGNLNAMGLNLNFWLIFHPNIIILFLNILNKVKNKIKIKYQ